MRFYIYAPSFDENSGGCIALHKLVHIINTETEHEAYLVPRVLEKIHFHNLRKVLSNLRLYWEVLKNKKNYITNPHFKTPVVKSIPKSFIDSAICVYPDVTFGNPLQAKNIVRWFLHQPGHFTKEVCVGVGELYFKFNSAIKHFELYGSKLSANELKVIHYPLEKYNTDNAESIRKGTCYVMRKGKHKKRVHDNDAICLDGLSHSEIADVFKRCERFISYDDYTAYSLFAVLCGCKSIVVPDEKTSITDWYPNEKDRYGIAYGFSEKQSDWAELTKNKVKDLVINEHSRSVDMVLVFIAEVENYFQQTNG
jgi:hypothetical protein